MKKKKKKEKKATKKKKKAAKQDKQQATEDATARLESQGGATKAAKADTKGKRERNKDKDKVVFVDIIFCFYYLTFCQELLLFLLLLQHDVLFCFFGFFTLNSHYFV